MWILGGMRWLLALPLALLWLGLALNNAFALVHRGPRGAWFLPLVGGISGVLAVLLLAGTTRWTWLPAALDMGCLPFLAWVLWRLAAVNMVRMRGRAASQRAPAADDASLHR